MGRLTGRLTGQRWQGNATCYLLHSESIGFTNDWLSPGRCAISDFSTFSITALMSGITKTAEVGFLFVSRNSLQNNEVACLCVNAAFISHNGDPDKAMADCPEGH